MGGMKLAFAGKGGVGKTTLAAWTADWLARSGNDVWMVDADTALSLGQASGLSRAELPEPLVARRDVINQRIGSGMLQLNPDVSDLPESLSVDVPVDSAEGQTVPGRKRLLLMGTIVGAGGGCACEANALLKAVLAHLVLERNDWVIVDLEAGVEHLGRGTVADVDGMIVVSEPSRRSLETAAAIGALAGDLGLVNQLLVLNRCTDCDALPTLDGLPDKHAAMPFLPQLAQRQLNSASVLHMPEQADIDVSIAKMLAALQPQ